MDFPDLTKIFGRKNRQEKLDGLAELIKNDPGLRTAFEKQYKIADFILDDSATVKNMRQQTDRKADTSRLEKLKDRIVDELMLISDNKTDLLTDKQSENAVQKEDIESFPEEIRPQLAGHLIHVDCDPNSSGSLALFLDRYALADNPREKLEMYRRIRYGIDILDIDPVIYELLGRDVNSIEYWFYRIKDAAEKENFFKIPETKIVQVPLPILQLTRLDYASLTQTTKDIVNKWCMKAFDLDESKSYFVKTGVFSYKYDFRNQKVSGDEVKCLGEYLLFISNYAVMLESPLSNAQGMSRYGAATTRTWCVREFIEDKENNPTIYHGLPLHTEYRVFVDFADKKILGITPYWREDVMEKRFAEDNNIHDRHDYIIYKSYKDVMYQRYNDNKQKVLNHIQSLLTYADFSGLPDQWSVDIMQNGDDFYIIDMALAGGSALHDCVPEELIKPAHEDLIMRKENEQSY